jgi:hypothetical protein
MTDPRDYKLDLRSMPEKPEEPSAGAARPYLRVHFACCNVYLRLYRRDTPTPHYAGACPRCAKPVRFAVSPGGNPARDYIVY